MCLAILEHLKDRIFNENAVFYTEEAIRLTRQLLTEQADIANAMYDLLDNEQQDL